jgi:hypothetical protein
MVIRLPTAGYTATVTIGGAVVSAVEDPAQARAPYHLDQVRLGFVFEDCSRWRGIVFTIDDHPIPSASEPVVNLSRMSVTGASFSRSDFGKIADAHNVDVSACGVRYSFVGDELASLRAFAKAARVPARMSARAVAYKSKEASLHVPLEAGWASVASVQRLSGGDGTASLAALVRDQSSRPLAGATVVAQGPSEQAELSDDGGHCLLRGLPPGDYVITFHSGPLQARVRATLAADTTTSVEAVVGVDKNPLK